MKHIPMLSSNHFLLFMCAACHDLLDSEQINFNKVSFKLTKQRNNETLKSYAMFYFFAVYFVRGTTRFLRSELNT